MIQKSIYKVTNDTQLRGWFLQKNVTCPLYGAIAYNIDRGFGFDIKSVQRKDACVSNFKEKYYDKFINPHPLIVTFIYHIHPER